ncbi:hypothetical protein [Nitrosomonas ureae]|uniref:Restriction endonuclease n=1 Tax=Nitrosomonas ureae TaxID=44577 RepID=A0A286A762_9PROT|nr:Restriction endonuclease [Nitrosomonas ureae]
MVIDARQVKNKTSGESMSALRELLASYRSASRTEREKGTYFELLIRDFLKNDLTYTPQFSEVWTYKDWAESQGIDSRDIGIDLVAGLNEQEGFCAIQCIGKYWSVYAPSTIKL